MASALNFHFIVRASCVSLRYVRGIQLKSWFLTGLLGIGGVCGLVAFIQLVLWIVSGTAADSGWWVLALVLLALGVWGRSSGVLVRLLADDDPGANRARQVAVWLLVVAMVLLIMGLKLSSPDLDAYKRLVFGEGGLVEWGQVLLLVAAIRVSWLIGDDLFRRLDDARPGWLARGFVALLGLLLLEELAWGQVIFSWQTPEAIRTINAQQETTLHNIGWFQDRLDGFTFLAMLVVLLAVVLAPQVARRLLRHQSPEQRSLVLALMPASYSWPLFLFVAVIAYCVATQSFSELLHNRDQEWGELVLYGSALLLLLRTRVLLGTAEWHAPGSEAEAP